MKEQRVKNSQNAPYEVEEIGGRGGIGLKESKN